MSSEVSAPTVFGMHPVSWFRDIFKYERGDEAARVAQLAVPTLLYSLEEISDSANAIFREYGERAAMCVSPSRAFRLRLR